LRRFRLQGRQQTEPLDDPVVGALGAWPSRQFSSDRYAKPPGPKAWAAFLFLDQIARSADTASAAFVLWPHGKGGKGDCPSR
jgi:hypothetical protein